MGCEEHQGAFHGVLERIQSYNIVCKHVFGTKPKAKPTKGALEGRLGEGAVCGHILSKRPLGFNVLYTDHQVTQVNFLNPGCTKVESRLQELTRPLHLLSLL